MNRFLFKNNVMIIVEVKEGIEGIKADGKNKNH